jgi:hypothetical protein
MRIMTDAIMTDALSKPGERHWARHRSTWAAWRREQQRILSWRGCWKRWPFREKHLVPTSSGTRQQGSHQGSSALEWTAVQSVPRRVWSPADGERTPSVDTLALSCFKHAVPYLRDEMSLGIGIGSRLLVLLLRHLVGILPSGEQALGEKRADEQKRTNQSTTIQAITRQTFS